MKLNRETVAVVTGAASGIGRALALRLAREGASLALADVNRTGLDETAQQVSNLGVKISTHLVDVSDQERVAAFAQEVLRSHGRVNLLVNNAGVTVRRLALDVTPEDWGEVVGVNLKGTFFMSQQMGRHLVATKRPGCVISIASTHGTIGFTQRSTYGISKAGIIHMTRMLAYEWAEHGIRVNAVAPGTVETRTRAEYFRANPVARQAMIDRVPLHRFGEPEEIAAAVRYLASPEAAYVTGQTLLLDGGLTSY